MTELHIVQNRITKFYLVNKQMHFKKNTKHLNNGFGCQNAPWYIALQYTADAFDSLRKNIKLILLNDKRKKNGE